MLIDSAETGGAETVFAELARRIDLARFTPVVGLLCDGWLTGQLRDAGIAPVMVPMSHGSFDHRLLRALRRLIRQESIDVVHAHLFSTATYASLSAALTGVPVVATFHGTVDVVDADRAKRLKWRIVNSLSSRTVFVSEYLRQYFMARRFVRPAISQVIYNGVDTARFREAASRAEARAALGLGPTDFVVGCVGDVRPSKDYHTALEALRVLRGYVPKLRAVIAGSVTEFTGPLLAHRDALGLAGVVDFIGFQPRVERVLPAFDAYLTTSISEGFSLTVVEAMAAGLPVVSTRCGGPEEIISPGENGLLVGVGAPAEIADALRRLHDDPVLARRLAVAATALADRQFSVGAMIENYETLYEDVAGSRRRRARGTARGLPWTVRSR